MRLCVSAPSHRQDCQLYCTVLYCNSVVCQSGRSGDIAVSAATSSYSVVESTSGSYPVPAVQQVLQHHYYSTVKYCKVL